MHTNQIRILPSWSSNLHCIVCGHVWTTKHYNMLVFNTAQIVIGQNWIPQKLHGWDKKWSRSAVPWPLYVWDLLHMSKKHTRIPSHIYTYLYVYKFANMYIYKNMYVYTYIYMYACIYMYVCLYIYINKNNINICTHTYIHKYMYIKYSYIYINACI